MIECLSLSTCPFFQDKLEKKPASAAVMKLHYCRKDSSNCARWIVASRFGKQAVPADLFPDQIERARAIVGVS